MFKELNQTQALILGTLHSGPKTGAEIIAIAEAIQGLWSSTRSQVYREIWRLETSLCLVVSEVPPPPGSKERYEVTPFGREAYRDWAEESAFTDSVRNPWILRLALAEHDGQPVKEILRAAVAYHRAREMNLNQSVGLGTSILRDYHRTCAEFFDAR